MNYDNIPNELKILNQWSVFKTYLDKESGKTKKIIISPNNAKFAKCNDASTWTDFNTAKIYSQKYNYNGLAFALTNNIVFIDLDNCIDLKTNKITNSKAKQILELLPNTYAEKSISGKGIHLLCKGELPQDCYNRNDKNGVEIYDTNRFICMTGDLLDNSTKMLKDYSKIIHELAYNLVGKKKVFKEFIPKVATKTDSELITQIQNSKQSVKFNALFNGDISSYPSHSHAESALVFMLAWWTQDTSQIDNIVRSSALFRSKWDSLRGNITYGKQLINQALSTVIPRNENVL